MENRFSEILCELRKRQGLSQRKAAADLHISQALLSHYENGAREPGLTFVCRACDYYGVSADQILGRVDAHRGVSGEDLTSDIRKLESELQRRGDKELYDAVCHYVSTGIGHARAYISGDSSMESFLERREQQEKAERELYRAAKKSNTSGETL